MTPFEATIYAYDAAGRRLARAHSGTAFAQGIPALTPATGYLALGDDMYAEAMINLNDTSEIDRPNMWPTRDMYNGRWCHSDIKDLAHFYVFKFYEKAIEKGDLK